jgi:hypothetical protein
MSPSDKGSINILDLCESCMHARSCERYQSLSSPSRIKQQTFQKKKKTSGDADGKPCPANFFIVAAPSTNGLMENFVSSERRTELVVVDL